MNLKSLGWDFPFEEAFNQYREAGFEPARIILREGNLYTAIGEAGELRGKMSGRMRYELTASGDFPAVGDWVAIEGNPKTASMTVQAVLPRRSKFVRATYNKGSYVGDQVICANVDFLIIVVGLDEEDPPAGAARAERASHVTGKTGSSLTPCDPGLRPGLASWLRWRRPGS